MPTSAAFRNSRGVPLLPPPELSIWGEQETQGNRERDGNKALCSITSPELSVGGTKETRWTKNGTRWTLRSRTWSARALGCVPSFNGGTLRLPLRNYPLRGRKRRGGLESGKETRWALQSLIGSAGTLVHVPSFEGGGHSVAPPELSVGGTKETRWTGDWDGNLLGF